MRIYWKIIQEKSTFPPDGIMLTNSIFAHTVPGSTSTDDLSMLLGEVLIAVIRVNEISGDFIFKTSLRGLCYGAKTFR